MGPGLSQLYTQWNNVFMVVLYGEGLDSRDLRSYMTVT